jgi:hypothetical protein
MFMSREQKGRKISQCKRQSTNVLKLWQLSDPRELHQRIKIAMHKEIKNILNSENAYKLLVQKYFIFPFAAFESEY